MTNELSTDNSQWAFLKSVRFWAMEITALSVMLIDPGFSTQPWYVSLSKFLALSATSFTAIRTIDRNTGDAKVNSANIKAENIVNK